MVQGNGTQNWMTIPIFNQQVPKEGPKALPLKFDFSTAASQTIDLQNMQSRGYVAEIQTIYFDNSLSSVPTSVTMRVTNQVLTCPPFSQGYFPILVPNPPVMTFANSGNAIVNVQLLNIPMPLDVWNTTNVGGFKTDANGNVLVSDQILETSLGASPVPMMNKAFANNDAIAPLYIGTRTAAAAALKGAVGVVTIYTGAPGWVLTGVQVTLSGLSTLAAAGDINFIVSSGATTLLRYWATIPTVATNISQLVVDEQNLNLYCRTSLDALTINISSPFTTGGFYYNLTYSQAGAQSVGV